MYSVCVIKVGNYCIDLHGYSILSNVSAGNPLIGTTIFSMSLILLPSLSFRLILLFPL